MWIPLDPCGYTISTTEKTNRTKRHLLRESREVSYLMWEILFADKILINSPFMLYWKRTSQYWSKMLKLQNAHFCLMLRMRSALHCNFYQPFIIGIKIYFTFHSIYKQMLQWESEIDNELKWGKLACKQVNEVHCRVTVTPAHLSKSSAAALNTAP